MTRRLTLLALLLLLLAFALQACIGRPRTRGGGGGDPDDETDDDDAADDDDASADDDDAADFDPNMWGQAGGYLDLPDDYLAGQGPTEFEMSSDGYATGEARLDLDGVTCELFLADVYAWSEVQFTGDVTCTGDFSWSGDAEGWLWGEADSISGQAEVWELAGANSLYFSFSASSEVPE